MTYEYTHIQSEELDYCTAGMTFEVEQRMSEPALTACPTCGQPVERVIFAAGVVKKGAGWTPIHHTRG